MKPIGLVEIAIRNSSKTRDIILDPFGGSGTTLMAAEATGRRAVLIELDPRYSDVIVRRWQDGTGKVARLESDGGSFEEIAGERLVEGIPEEIGRGLRVHQSRASSLAEALATWLRDMCSRLSCSASPTRSSASRRLLQATA
jgi:hypothetical protein